MLTVVTSAVSNAKDYVCPRASPKAAMMVAAVVFLCVMGNYILFSSESRASPNAHIALRAVSNGTALPSPPPVPAPVARTDDSNSEVSWSLGDEPADPEADVFYFERKRLPPVLGIVRTEEASAAEHDDILTEQVATRKHRSRLHTQSRKQPCDHLLQGTPSPLYDELVGTDRWPFPAIRDKSRTCPWYPVPEFTESAPLVHTKDLLSLHDSYSAQFIPLPMFDSPNLPVPKFSSNTFLNHSRLEEYREVNASHVVSKLPDWRAHYMVLYEATVHSEFGIVGDCNATWLSHGCDHKFLRQGQVHPPRPTLFYNRLVVGTTMYGSNLYHLTMNGLIKAAMLLPMLWADKEIKILLPAFFYHNGRDKDWIQLLGLDPERVLYMSANNEHTFVAHQVYLPSGVDCMAPPREPLRFMRTVMWRRLGLDEKHIGDVHSGPVIVLRRPPGTDRSLKNHRTMIVALRRAFPKQEFIEWMDQDEPVAETAKLLHSARAFMAPHGAGLVFLTFMRRGAAVLEITPDMPINTCFFGMASAFGMRYFVSGVHEPLYKNQPFSANVTDVVDLTASMLGVAAEPFEPT